MKTRDIIDVVSSFSNEQIDIIREASNHEEISDKEFTLLSDPTYSKEQMQALYDLMIINSSDGLSKHNRLKFKYLESLMDNNMDEFQLRAIAKYITNRHFDKKEFAKVNQPALTGAQIIFIYSLFNLIDKNAINKKKGTDPEYDIFSRLHKKKVNHLIEDITNYPEIYDVVRLDTTIQMLSDKEFKNSFVEKFVYDEECDAESFHVNLMYKYYHSMKLNRPSYEHLFLTTNNYLNYDEAQLTTILTAYSKNNIEAKNFEHVIIPSIPAEVMAEKIREILQNQLLDDEGLRQQERVKKEARIKEIEAEKQRLIDEVKAENKEMLARHNQKTIEQIDQRVKANAKPEVIVEKPVEVKVKPEVKAEPKLEVQAEPQITKAPIVKQEQVLTDTIVIPAINQVDEVEVFVDKIFDAMEKENAKAKEMAEQKQKGVTPPMTKAEVKEQAQAKAQQMEQKPVVKNPDAVQMPYVKNQEPQAKVEVKQPVTKQPFAPKNQSRRTNIVMQPNTVHKAPEPKKVEAKDPSDLDHLDH